VDFHFRFCSGPGPWAPRGDTLSQEYLVACGGPEEYRKTRRISVQGIGGAGQRREAIRKAELPKRPSELKKQWHL